MRTKSRFISPRLNRKTPNLYRQSQHASNHPVRLLRSAMLLLLCRVLWRWNQTGQKHAGEPDIARNYLPAHKQLLWVLVLLTYLDVVRRLAGSTLKWAPWFISTQIAITLGFCAFAFKISFTEADAPELLSGLQSYLPTQVFQSSLVQQAQAVFAGISALAILTVGPALYQRFQSKQSPHGNQTQPALGHIRDEGQP